MSAVMDLDLKRTYTYSHSLYTVVVKRKVIICNNDFPYCGCVLCYPNSQMTSTTESLVFNVK